MSPAPPGPPTSKRSTPANTPPRLCDPQAPRGALELPPAWLSTAPASPSSSWIPGQVWLEACSDGVSPGVAKVGTASRIRAPAHPAVPKAQLSWEPARTWAASLGRTHRPPFTHRLPSSPLHPHRRLPRSALGCPHWTTFLPAPIPRTALPLRKAVWGQLASPLMGSVPLGSSCVCESLFQLEQLRLAM